MLRSVLEGSWAFGSVCVVSLVSWSPRSLSGPLSGCCGPFLVSSPVSWPFQPTFVKRGGEGLLGVRQTAPWRRRHSIWDVWAGPCATQRSLLPHGKCPCSPTRIPKDGPVLCPRQGIAGPQGTKGPPAERIRSGPRTVHGSPDGFAVGSVPGGRVPCSRCWCCLPWG